MCLVSLACADIKVDFDDRMLRISAERREEKKQESDRYYLSERRYGSTSRSIRLPTDAARYENTHTKHYTHMHTKHTHMIVGG